ncbi:MAG: DedA family protein [Acidobacteriota bacterium]|nr:DedA family protein [Acidobacteriota bacterium]
MLVDVPSGLGYAAIFLLAGGESAGLPVPGETSLIAGAVLAAHGRLSLPLVLAAAAGAAVLGDNLGYLIGHRGVRRLLLRGRRRARLLARSEPLFARYGSRAVFFGRWLPVLRVTAAWLAGANRMPWRRFALWNALGGIAWASSVGTAAYLLGTVASHAIAAVGLAMTALAVLGVLGQLLWCRLTRRPGLCLAARGS